MTNATEYLQFIPPPAPEAIPARATAFSVAKMQIGYLFHLVVGVEVLVGALLSGRPLRPSRAYADRRGRRPTSSCSNCICRRWELSSRSWCSRSFAQRTLGALGQAVDVAPDFALREARDVVGEHELDRVFDDHSHRETARRPVQEAYAHADRNRS